MPAKKEIKVNLLPQKEFEKSVLGRALKWGVSSFRVIVIVTEMVVMGAFLSRFWLDAKNSDLNEEINQKKAVISSYSETESAFRTLQKQIEVFAEVSSSETKTEYLNLIISLTPVEITLNSVSYNQDSIEVTAHSGSEQKISQFIKNLSSNEKFENVSLNKIGSDENNLSEIVFSVRMEVAKK